ncbi:sensor histidine kinase [Qipengyuania sp.]|uniref:sensor histidine kinase n=1 Tax=Qipengyuania sp. TaxID=2004515 RepID=UPI0035C7F017
MLRGKPFPLSAAVLALIVCVILGVAGLPIGLAALTLVIWVGSLWIVGVAPPKRTSAPAARAFDTHQMGELFELSENPVLITRRDRVVVANASARRLFGAHLLDQDIRMSLRDPEAVKLVESGETGGVTISGLTRRKDIWRVNRKALPGELGIIEFINRTAEADISRAHTDFVANASHELRTPLSSIIGYVETLREESDHLEKETADKFLSTIQREARRLQSLVGDLMSLSRIEAEKHDLPVEEIELSILTERAARDAAGTDHARQLALAIDPGIQVRGDSQQLEQLVRNLVDNALKYGGGTAPVSVGLKRSGEDRATLSVVDKGDGIAPEHLPHLTRRFYRTDPGRSRASGGTGLGLAIVKHIVERHRGRLSIDSVVGTGTTVTVALPLT